MIRIPDAPAHAGAKAHERALRKGHTEANAARFRDMAIAEAERQLERLFAQPAPSRTAALEAHYAGLRPSEVLGREDELRARREREAA